MNDRYLFRAKRIDNGEWIEGYYLFCPIQADNKPSLENFTYKHWIVTHNGNPFNVDKFTICQCTGLKDKNGKLIWENDVVLEDWSNYKGIIKFGEFENQVLKNIGFNIDWSKKAVSYRQDLPYWTEKCEVIGNIFDNPELIHE